ncbi:MAG: type 2 isopentenyl-diphosphate Delta-isomerase [Euryarchaeota archaeon]|nr:type 2 isopentenyl-diphosphate Delta-isomerase [Euryarchaeota archaeon]MDE2046312.1 type 2 isopentenyl-diphosphate Delta-isomerase [Thermoplasmata archaeon]
MAPGQPPSIPGGAASPTEPLDEEAQFQRDVLLHRKAEHVQIVLGKEDVQSSYRFWEDVQLVHNSLPEVDFDKIDTRVKLLGKELAFPLVITGMTGGYPGAAFINRNLARAAAEVGVAFGVGSERAAIVKGAFPESYSCAKDYSVPLKIANIGAPQIIPQADGGRPVGAEEARRAMELIGANVLAVHLNPLQERIQPEGDRNARGCLEQIGKLAKEFPILAKETGAGISKDVATRLKRVGVKAFDVSGRGGTSFAAVEYHRAVKQGAKRQIRLGKTFWDWGIPAPVSLLEVLPQKLPVIASGGVRSGLDAARALALGATAVGFAGGILKAASTSYGDTVEELRLFEEELKTAMFLTGAATVVDLKKVRKIVTGQTAMWLRGHEI